MDFLSGAELYSHSPLFLQGLSVQAHRQQDPCLTTDWQASAPLTARKRHWMRWVGLATHSPLNHDVHVR
jgi:hypothetical protein